MQWTTGEIRDGEVREFAIFEVILTKNSPKLITETQAQIQEAQRTPSIKTKNLQIDLLYSNHRKPKTKRKP